MEVFYSPQFERDYKKLSFEIKEKAKEKEKIFRVNPFDPRLKTHKLHGELEEFWGFSIDYQFRVVFSFFGEKKVKFYAIGGHSIYEKF